MNVPPIQYAQSADGVDIAYWRLGSGPPVIILNQFVTSHIELECGVERMASGYERLAERFTVVRLDLRNHGLSTRNVEAIDIASLAGDLAAVVDALDSPVSLVGVVNGGRVALRYAAEHPQRVRRIALLEPPDWGVTNDPRFDGVELLAPLISRNWPMYARLFATAVVGLDEPRFAREFATLIEGSMNPYDYRRMGRAIQAAEFAPDLPRIRCPLLVARQSAAPIDLARRLVAQVPDSRVVSLAEGDWFWGPSEVAAVIEFLRDDASWPSPSMPRFRTILFTDVVSSTPLLAQLKDAKMRAVMRDHDAVLEAAVQEHGGRVVKEIGDAFMAEFAVPSAAVECAIAIQRGIRAKFADSDVPLRLRIGINAGEPVEEDGDLHGASVVIAKRLESAAPENGILVSDVVRQAVAGKDFVFADRGTVELKGLDEPVRAWTVEWIA